MNTLVINQLNTEEKIFAMERLWDDLCHHADSVKTPEWHKTVLKERMKLVESVKRNGDRLTADRSLAAIRLERYKK